MELIPDDVRPTMEARCHLCAFAAQHTADSTFEGLLFLRRVLLEHASDAHEVPANYDWDAAINRITRTSRSSRRPCDHKFIDSACCVKCGWVPGPA